VWAALKTGLYVVLFLRGHAIWVIIAETVSSLFSNPADATTPEKRKRAQEAKDEARGVTVAASFGGGLLLIFVAVSAVAQAEAWSSSGGEVGLIWIISAHLDYLRTHLRDRSDPGDRQHHHGRILGPE
jgi:hypothetical protein